MPQAKQIVVITGAGISAESGLSTFRDSGGLWEGYDINEVASIDGWRINPEKVLDFYNLRRKQALEAKPNNAHKALADLQNDFDVQIITQNVDDLHEKAGSKNVLHLHGELNKAKSSKVDDYIVDIGSQPIELGDKAADGSQLRPHVVWFGELVPNLEKAAHITSKADILIVIGTSLVVYPAAGLIDYVKQSIPKYIIDPSEPEFRDLSDWNHIKEKAASGTPKLVKKLKDKR
ncbi:SIR2 family NAD-dependent protein deacylase [Gracilimonas sp. Q87]|uniref:SIR2 family NAD-dependent protein deacylase n=1 Tax=Gracilimonas sp. Q87 TaxID=3384766 RepID=UPI0039842556